MTAPTPRGSTMIEAAYPRCENCGHDDGTHGTAHTVHTVDGIDFILCDKCDTPEAITFWSTEYREVTHG